jgi:hypothetical protein
MAATIMIGVPMSAVTATPPSRVMPMETVWTGEGDEASGAGRVYLVLLRRRRHHHHHLRGRRIL